MLDEAGRAAALARRPLQPRAPTTPTTALSTADIKFPTVTLSDGEEVTVTLRPTTARCSRPTACQADRAPAFAAHHRAPSRDRRTPTRRSTTACCSATGSSPGAQRYATTLDAALDGNAIPAAVVETLIEATRAGVAPLQRYHRLRKRAARARRATTSTTASIPIVEFDQRYRTTRCSTGSSTRSAPLGATTRRAMRTGFAGRWIDVYENAGKRSGAYSAPVYGVHPVHAAQLQRHARRRLHAGPRDRPLDAHAAVARDAAVRRTRATRSSSPRCRRRSARRFCSTHAARSRRSAGARGAAAARHRRDRRHLLHAGAVRRLRAAGAPPRRARRADHGRRARARSIAACCATYYGDAVDATTSCRA